MGNTSGTDAMGPTRTTEYSSRRRMTKKQAIADSDAARAEAEDAEERAAEADAAREQAERAEREEKTRAEERERAKKELDDIKEMEDQISTDLNMLLALDKDGHVSAPQMRRAELEAIQKQFEAWRKDVNERLMRLDPNEEASDDVIHHDYLVLTDVQDTAADRLIGDIAKALTHQNEELEELRGKATPEMAAEIGKVLDKVHVELQKIDDKVARPAHAYNTYHEARRAEYDFRKEMGADMPQ